MQFDSVRTLVPSIEKQVRVRVPQYLSLIPLRDELVQCAENALNGGGKCLATALRSNAKLTSILRTLARTPGARMVLGTVIRPIILELEMDATTWTSSSGVCLYIIKCIESYSISKTRGSAICKWTTYL